MRAVGGFLVRLGYCGHKEALEVVPVGVLVFGVVHHDVAVAHQVVHGRRVAQVRLLSEMLGQVLLCGLCVCR